MACASVADDFILLVMFFALLAIEALHTAIECIVEHLAPACALFTSDAKDLGSRATIIVLAASAVFIAQIVYLPLVQI